MIEVQRLTARPETRLVERGRDRIARAPVAAARIRNEKKDPLGHQTLIRPATRAALYAAYEALEYVAIASVPCGGDAARSERTL